MKTLQLRQTYADLQQVLGFSDAEFDVFLAQDDELRDSSRPCKTSDAPI